MASALDTQFSGQFSVETQYSWAELSEPTRTLDTILHFQPELDLKFNRRSRMHFKPLLRSNISTEEKPEQLFLNAQEAYWEIKTHPLRVRLGQNIYNWGVLDGYSPVDVVNGRVMYNPLMTDKRGAPTVDLNYEGDGFQLQLLYVPLQARTILPSTDSRWLPREVIIANTKTDEGTLVLPNIFKYYYPGYDELDDALANNFGARLSRRWNDFDLALTYFEGSNIVPQVRLQVQADLIPVNPPFLQARSDIGLMPIYYRQRTVGGTLVWAPSDIIIKAESAYSHSISENTLIPAWSWQNGLGLELPWHAGSSSFTSVFQVYYGENRDPIDNLISSSGRLFDRSLIVGTRWSASTETNLLVSFLYDYQLQSYFFHGVFDHKFSEKFKGEISLDVIEGDANTLLGTYDKNDRVCLKLSYLW